MSVACSYKELVSVENLAPHPKNPNTHPKDQIDRLAKLITYYGFRHPIIVSKLSGYIVAGHGRLEAAKHLGLKEVPVDYQDFANDAEEYGFLVSDNAISGWSELELARINVDLTDLGPDFDIDLLGIKDFEIEAADKFHGDEDAVPEPPKDPVSKIGDLYELGNHRVLCGDSTNIESVEKLLNGQIADIGFTSPPYNANKNAGGLIPKKYESNEDAMGDPEFEEFLSAFTAITLKKTRFSFVNIQMLSHNKMPIFNWQNRFKEQIKDILIWTKNIAPPQINKGTFNSKWEYVFCFSEESPKSRSFPCMWHGQYPNIIQTENASRNEYAEIHRATFPVALPKWVIEKMDFCESVLDLFGGSGTTMVACESLRRKSFLMELDPLYVDVIVSRWCKFTGQSKIKRNGEEIEWAAL